MSDRQARPVDATPHILCARPLRADDRLIAFAASDTQGPLELCVSLTHWEQLQAQAPLPANAEDRRDFALGTLEALAAHVAPSTTSAGTRLLFVG